MLNGYDFPYSIYLHASQESEQMEPKILDSIIFLKQEIQPSERLGARVTGIVGVEPTLH